MHDLNFREMTKEQLAEESFIDLAYAILDEKKSAISFNQLVGEIQSIVGLTDEEMKARLVQFYTDLNVDGRFLVNTESGWGLRSWYKIETIEEETAPTVKTRKKKTKAVADDEDLIELEEEDLDFEEDFDEFVEDEDEEEIDDDEEEAEDLDFVAEEIEDLDEDIEEDIEEDIIVEDEEFDLDEDEEEEFFEEDEK